jgi:hypothetical protein
MQAIVWSSHVAKFIELAEADPALWRILKDLHLIKQHENLKTYVKTISLDRQRSTWDSSWVVPYSNTQAERLRCSFCIMSNSNTLTMKCLTNYLCWASPFWEATSRSASHGGSVYGSGRSIAMIQKCRTQCLSWDMWFDEYTRHRSHIFPYLSFGPSGKKSYR